ncbi:LTA synthase family protein [Paenibacillus sp. GCM10023252]|uniref:LTA synthase family protein n=1 Tax=Paenibacillus sp. GCM10023252 TaxID=3252649 RepID=UPI003A9567EE
MILFRTFVFDGVMVTRLLTDAAAIVILLGIVELAASARWRGPLYWMLNGLLSLLLFASTLYFSYYGTVPTYTALLALDQVLQIRDSVKSTINPIHYVFFLDLAVYALMYGYNRMKGNRITARTRIAKPLYVGMAVLLCILMSAGSIRIGSSIPNELVQSEQLGFLNYQAASALKARKEVSEAKDGDAATAAAAAAKLQDTYDYTKGFAAGDAPASFGAAEGKNVIVIQLEAFQNFPVGLKLEGTEVTPVLNKLGKDSLYFPHFFQQIGQGNTSDAEFMSNTSIYPTGDIAMSTGYGDRSLPSLPRLLEKRGYEAVTFHVNDVTFWDRNRMYPALGFDRYYDKPYFNNDHFNDFGASDEEMYRVGLEQLGELAAQDKPFYAQFVSTSSHFPFKVPGDRQHYTVPEQLKGTQLGDYLTAVNYADYALGVFIEGLKAKGLWDNTMLVIYGDHFGLQAKENDPAWVSKQLGITYHERLSRFNIPFFLHVPGVEGKVVDQVGGQLDIMPTVSNLMGISLPLESYTAFGQDLLNIDQNVIGMRYYLPTGSFFNNDILFVPGKGFDDGTAVDIRTMEPVADFSKYRKDYDYILDLMKASDTYVRLLPKRTP